MFRIEISLVGQVQDTPFLTSPESCGQVPNR
jgi:hypothetical protein